MITTQVLLVQLADPQPELIARAAAIIRAGGLVAFPTETVYGLGADALNREAVARIFTAKGRPVYDPLIVHIASPDELTRVARSVPETARLLAERFWPGPLTLVLPRAAAVPT
ncbi:MAG: Sua5/YciO/YrdC/YwlC family protein, partial [Anaerolineae bacterium]|nr:Sua5/YciO/YrdC/YwlC family protein [Anaerolineae bacterium]